MSSLSLYESEARENVLFRKPKTRLLFPYKMSNEEIDELEVGLREYEFSGDEIDFLMFNERWRPEDFKLRDYYDRITQRHASRFSLGDRPLTAEEFVRLSIGNITIFPEGRKFFDETFPNVTFDGRRATKEDLNKEVEKWAKIENLLSMRAEPRNVEPAMLAAAFADTSYENSWNILHGVGRTRGNKPYPALIYRTPEITDFFIKKHKSVLETFSGMIFSHDDLTRYDPFTNNSQYKALWVVGSEEKSFRDVPGIMHIIPMELWDKEELLSRLTPMTKDFTDELRKIYEMKYPDGKTRIPSEDIAFAPLFSARTATTTYSNPLSLAERSGLIQSNPDETLGFKMLNLTTIEAAEEVLPTFAPTAVEAAKKAGYVGKPFYLEEFSDVTFGKDCVKVRRVYIPDDIIQHQFTGLNDPAHEKWEVEFEIEGTGRLQAELMRHNAVTSFTFESLRHAAKRWSEGQSQTVKPKSVEMHPEAHKSFIYENSLAKEMYKLVESYEPSTAFYFMQLGAPVRSRFVMNGASFMNFLSQRIDNRAMWEIRRAARTIYNDIDNEPETYGFLSRDDVLGWQVVNYERAGEAHVVGRRYEFIPEKMAIGKAGV